MYYEWDAREKYQQDILKRSEQQKPYWKLQKTRQLWQKFKTYKAFLKALTFPIQISRLTGCPILS